MPNSLCLLSTASELPDGPLAGGLDITRYLLVCGGLIALIVGLGWGFKRWVAGGLRARASQRSLEVLDVLPLGGRQKVGVVRCYDRSFLLGFGDREVQLIAELEASPQTDPASSSMTAAQRGIFSAALQRAALASRGQPGPQPRAAAPRDSVAKPNEVLA